MRKIIIALLLVLCVSCPAYARFWDGSNQGMTKELKTFQVINSSDVDLNTAVPSTSITAGSIIYGFDVLAYSASNGDFRVGFNDTVTDLGIVHQECIMEAEMSPSVTSHWFIYPILIKTSLQVTQGSNTIVYIYYGR